MLTRAPPGTIASEEDNVDITNIVIGVAVLALLIARQLMKRSVNEDSRPTILLILGVLGIVQIGQFFTKSSVSPTAIAALIASLVIAGGFGVARAYTVRLWRADGTLWRQGGWLTALLWIVAIAVHVGADVLVDGSAAGRGLSSASILLYIAVSFGIQRMVITSRARQVPA